MVGDPVEVIDRAERRKETIRDHYLPAAEWFLEEGGLNPRTEVVADLATHLDINREVANLVVGHLVADEADPVQQVVDPIDGKYVGVIDHAEHDWFYAFDRYDDVDGRQRRAVCAHCVHEKPEATDVAHFTRSPEEYDLDIARTALALHYQVDHENRGLADVLAEDLGVDPAAFADRHGLPGAAAISLRDVIRRLDSDPDLSAALARSAPSLPVPDVDVDPGASLVSGTTISGNTAWHAGNDGPGTGLDADTLDGYQASRFLKYVKVTTRTTIGDSIIELLFSTPLPTTARSARLYYYQAGTDPTFSYFGLSQSGNTIQYYSQSTLVSTTITTTSIVGILFYNTQGAQTTVGGTAKLYY